MSDAVPLPLPPSPPLSVAATPQTLSHVRAEGALDDASTVPARASPPPDPHSIPIHAPNGTPPPMLGHLLPDVEMAELAAPAVVPINGREHDAQLDLDSPMRDEPPLLPNGINGHGVLSPQSVTLDPDDTGASVPPSLAGTTPEGASTYSNSNIRPAPDSIDDAPPAKRARKLSNADDASLNHTNGNGITPPSPSPAHLGPITTQQFRFLTSTLRNMKKTKDATPFLHPVDPVALNIPHYPTIVKHPMDLATVERKLVASNPSTAHPDPNALRYHSPAEFVADVRVIFDNCLRFNGPDHVVTQMGKRIEGIFEKQMRHLPASEAPKPLPAPKKHVSPPPPPPPVVVKQEAPPPKKPAARRQSTANNAGAVPTIRRSESEMNTRPKREIHPPAPKDLPYADQPKKTRGKKLKDDGTAEQLKFCSRLIQELFKKQHYLMASPFYEPVDWVKMDLPSYPKIVKKPMDLSTMKKKLDLHEYSDATKFFGDFKLMLRNCFAFNPVGTHVNQVGMDLQAFFDEKWLQLPPLKDVVSDDEDDDDDTDDEQDQTVALLTSQLEQVKHNLAALSKQKKKKKDKVSKQHHSGAAGGSSRAPKSSKKTKTKGRAAHMEEEVLSFDQKKDLSETIQTLDGAKLERVIQIIHEGVPEIRDSTEEIELDIDSLPAAVLLKLYTYVLRPIRPKAGPARGASGRHATGQGTGGIKRKSMDEEAEAERIRLLEERIRLFDREQGGGGGGDADSGRSSDSSDSDSSGSESE